jgi:hypothetical protein
VGEQDRLHPGKGGGINIHFDPVKAGLALRPEEYRWSSAWLYHAGLWSDETGLPLTGLYFPGDGSLTG